MAVAEVVSVVLGVLLVSSVVAGIFAYKMKKSPYQMNRYRSISSSSSSRQSRKYFHGVSKIAFDSRDQIRLTNTNSQLYKGTFEGSIDVAVKKTHLPSKSKKQVKADLTSLRERLERVVDINHELVSECSVLNIVKFFCCEFEKEKGKLYLLLALELCDSNLEEYIQCRHTQYPLISNSTIILQLLKGLQYLHSRQIVHRDLKPSNILIKQNHSELTFKLSDFGFSKMNISSNNGIPSERSNLTGDYGTPGWIPPEIFSFHERSVPNQDRSYWKRSDIFPMGLIFYFIETDGKNVFKTQKDIQRGNADFTHVSGNYSLLQLLRHMLAPKPEDRPFTEHIIKHLALWSTEKTLDFIDNTSNLLMDRTLLSACPIEQNVVNVLGGDWRVHLSPAVESYLFPLTGARNRSIKSKNQPSYDKTSVQSLLRVIRNNKGHYYQLTLSVQTELGNFPDGYLNYWTSRFPQLLMHTYDVMNVHSTHSCMSKFYV